MRVVSIPILAHKKSPALPALFRYLLYVSVSRQAVSGPGVPQLAKPNRGVFPFVPRVFRGQICFRLFRLLLLYHHPRLCRFLDQYQLQPELYATPWFMTLFSNSLDLPRLYEVNSSQATVEFPQMWLLWYVYTHVDLCTRLAISRRYGGTFVTVTRVQPKAVSDKRTPFAVVGFGRYTLL